MRFFFITCLFVVSTILHAETLKLVTGEYSPYSGEKLPRGGLSTQVVTAAFKEVKIDVVINFMPWNRAMNNLKSTSAAGSFPWNKNTERDELFLYSDPISKYKNISFVKKGSALEKDGKPEGRKICLPSGWDAEQTEFLVKKYKMVLERPISIDQCFSMLALGRVDLFIANEFVAHDFLKTAYPKDSPISELNSEILNKTKYHYFIVAKKYPNAKRIIADFNRGLGLIKANGSYDKIMNAFGRKETLKSTCVICNQLGSL